jgi:hypothetical protein
VSHNQISPPHAGQTADAPINDGPQASFDGLAVALAADAELSEDQALSLLTKTDLSTGLIEKISKNPGLMKGRKVRLALIGHPATRRHISIPLLRHLFTFELIDVGLNPRIAADIKRAADEVLLHRLKVIPLGERLSLAKRASGRIAAELLLDTEPRTVSAALENPRLTEALVIRPLMRRDAPAALIHAVCRHPAWSVRREIRRALLRHENTPSDSAFEFAKSFSRPQLWEILLGSDLPAKLKSSLLKDAERIG